MAFSEVPVSDFPILLRVVSALPFPLNESMSDRVIFLSA